jgi:hypothetical protein
VKCQNCGGHTVLPNRIPQEISSRRYYWPKDERQLVALCRHCGWLSFHLESEVHPIAVVQDTGPSPRPAVLWKVTVVCDHENCGKKLAVYTLRDAAIPRSDIGIAVLSAKPALICPDLHTVANPRDLSIQQIPESESGSP